MEALFVYITCGSQEEAQKIGASLVQDRLAACANIIPGMTSIYQWKGKIEQDQEIVLIAKTTRSQLEALTQHVTQLHSYEVPCVVALPIQGGNPDYLQWIKTVINEQ